MSNKQFWKILIIVVVVLSLGNLTYYVFKNHTFVEGYSVKYDNDTDQFAFEKSLDYYGIPFQKREDGFIQLVQYYRSKVDLISKHLNYKVVKIQDREYETKRLENAGYYVSAVPYGKNNCDYQRTSANFRRRCGIGGVLVATYARRSTISCKS